MTGIMCYRAFSDWLHLVLCACVLSHVQLFVTLWTIAHQVPLSMGFSGKNTGVGCHFLIQGIFLTQRLNSGLLHYRKTLYHLSHQGSHWFIHGLLFPQISIRPVPSHFLFFSQSSPFPSLECKLHNSRETKNLVCLCTALSLMSRTVPDPK